VVPPAEWINGPGSVLSRGRPRRREPVVFLSFWPEMALAHEQSHGPHAPHGGGHDQGGHAAAPGRTLGRRMGLAVLLTLAFVAAEASAGWLANSLALLSDAGHNFADAAALGLSWYALVASRKPAHGRMTYGYHRVGILAALVNAIGLVVIALAILWEGIDRLRRPEAASGGLMTGVAAIAIALNLVIAAWLRRGARHDLNVRSALWHMIGDAVSAAGVVVAGVVVMLTGAPVADPIVSLLIAGMVLWSSWGILRESVGVLLEGTPRGMDLAEVIRAVEGVPGVLGSHDLHVWTVGPGAIAASLHILVAQQSIREGQQVLRRVVEVLEEKFRINHATVQVEVEGHDSNEMYCRIEPVAGETGGDAGHHH
jgi:cobalt-zinc-cadmium efflux system protein